MFTNKKDNSKMAWDNGRLYDLNIYNYVAQNIKGAIISGRYSTSPLQQKFCKSATTMNHPLLSQSDLHSLKLEQFIVSSLPDNNGLKYSSNHSSAMLKYSTENDFCLPKVNIATRYLI